MSAGTILLAEDDPNDVILFQRAMARASLSAYSLKVVQDGGNVIISWSGNGYQLQGTPSIHAPPIVWTTIPGQSPVPLPIGNTNRFFRLICR